MTILSSMLMLCFCVTSAKAVGIVRMEKDRLGPGEAPVVVEETRTVFVDGHGALLQTGGLYTPEALDSMALVEHRSIETSIATSLEYSRQFASFASDMPEGVAKSLFDSFRICGQCNSFQRFGGSHDGGYLMCMDGIDKKSVMAAYSLGVCNKDQWSEDVSKYFGTKVNMFDCTVSDMPKFEKCPSCEFFKKCIVSADGKNPVPHHESEGWSLEQAISETGQAKAKDGSLLLKMDIEGSEWAIWAAEPPEQLKKFGQIIVEFHNLGVEGRYPEYLQAVQHIFAGGFKIAHLHGNNNCGLIHRGSNSIPNVVEVTFVRSEARPNGCSTDEIRDKLDEDNIAKKPTQPAAHLG